MSALPKLLADPRQAPRLLVSYTLASIALFLLMPSTLTYLLCLASLLFLHLSPWDAPLTKRGPLSRLRWKLVLAALILVIALPVGTVRNTALMSLTIQVAINVALALGLNLVVGFAGLLDLGYIAFLASGAYVYAIFASPQAAQFWSAMPAQGLDGHWFWLFLPIALIAAALTGIALGLPVLRLRGDYLAIVTLGFGEIVRLLLRNLDQPVNITNGSRGITPIVPPKLFGLTLGTPVYFYFMGLVFAVLTLVVIVRLERSRIGRAWAAMREDEVAARAMGVPMTKMKLLAFATGACFAGLMGVVFVVKQNFVNPESFTFLDSIGILAMVILGGLGSTRGAIIGAALVTILKFQLLKELADYFALLNLPNAWNLAKYQALIFGLILVTMMIFRREGLLPAPKRTEDLAALEAADLPATAGPPASMQA